MINNVADFRDSNRYGLISRNSQEDVQEIITGFLLLKSEDDDVGIRRVKNLVLASIDACVDGCRKPSPDFYSKRAFAKVVLRDKEFKECAEKGESYLEDLLGSNWQELCGVEKYYPLLTSVERVYVLSDIMFGTVFPENCDWFFAISRGWGFVGAFQSMLLRIMNHYMRFSDTFPSDWTMKEAADLMNGFNGYGDLSMASAKFVERICEAHEVVIREVFAAAVGSGCLK